MILIKQVQANIAGLLPANNVGVAPFAGGEFAGVGALGITYQNYQGDSYAPVEVLGNPPKLADISLRATEFLGPEIPRDKEETANFTLKKADGLLNRAPVEGSHSDFEIAAVLAERAAGMFVTAAEGERPAKVKELKQSEREARLVASMAWRLSYTLHGGLYAVGRGIWNAYAARSPAMLAELFQLGAEIMTDESLEYRLRELWALSQLDATEDNWKETASAADKITFMVGKGSDAGEKARKISKAAKKIALAYSDYFEKDLAIARELTESGKAFLRGFRLAEAIDIFNRAVLHVLEIQKRFASECRMKRGLRHYAEAAVIDIKLAELSLIAGDAAAPMTIISGMEPIRAVYNGMHILEAQHQFGLLAVMNYADAFAESERAMDSAKKADDSELYVKAVDIYVKALANIGLLFIRTGLGEIAEKYFKKIDVTLKDNLGKMKDYAWLARMATAYVDAGEAEQNNSNTDGAISYYSKAEEIIRGLQPNVVADGFDMGRFLKLKGFAFHWRDRFQEAVELFKRAKAIFEEKGDKKEAGFVTHMIAVCHYRMGEYFLSHRYFLEALKIAEALGDKVAVEKARNWLREISEKVGAQGGSLEVVEDKPVDPAGSVATEAPADTGDAFAASVNDAERMLRKYYRELAMRRGADGTDEGRGYQLLEKGYQHIDADEIDEGLKALKEAVVAFDAGGDEFEAQSALGSIGAAYLLAGKYAEAVVIYDELLKRDSGIDPLNKLAVTMYRDIALQKLKLTS